MKKVLVVTLVVAVGFALGGMAYAAWGGGGRGPGSMMGGGYGPGSGSQVDVNALRSFQKETLPLRDELIAKRVELQNEYAKENPDQNLIATLQKEMIDLETKIQDSARKQGLSDWGPGSMMGGGGRGPGSMMGGGGQGRGWMMGGGGYGSGSCPMW